MYWNKDILVNSNVVGAKSYLPYKVLEDNHTFLFLAYVLDIQCNLLLCSHHYNVFQYFRETLFLSVIGKNIQICRIPGVPIIIRYSFDSNN